MGMYGSHRLASAQTVSREGVLPGLNHRYAFPSWYRTIPPERIGLDGRYDYHGLQKRVEVAFRKHFELQDLERLSVGQRGRVVILYGRVPTRQMLRRLIEVAERVEGTIRVEAAWIVFDSEDELVHSRIN